ncbi:MAG: 16S rRNA (guanine(527)-N(7))-methyltransferase RsmG [Snowella sp.]|nr:16S rRNA (guanine(527)-N(7))-methyltransferase RsmG [Snowella sp.]
MTELLSLPHTPEIWQQTLNWQPNEQQWQQFQHLYDCVLEGNKRFNLTRITDPLDFLEKHLWDSLAGLMLTDTLKRDEAYKVMDIGTGAGFPGLPTAIVCPEWTVTLLDSTRKKIDFLVTVLQALALRNGKTLLGRSEVMGRDRRNREKFDLALIRAVGEASVCAEYSLPLLKLGGLAILYRGHWTEEDTEKFLPSLAELGGTLEQIKTIETPWSQGIRNFIYLRKIQPTPSSYPRATGIPTQKPL